MKPIPFTIPHAGNESIRIQEDALDHFYPHFHEHPEMQLSWIIKGKGTLLVEHDMIPFQENNIFLIGAKQAHVFKSSANNHEGIKSIGIYFDPQKKLKSLFELPECARIRQFFETHQKGMQFQNTSIEYLSHSIKALQKSSGIERIRLFLSMLEYISSIKNSKPLTSASVSHTSLRMDERIQKIVEFSFVHFKDEITLAQVASMINLTPPAFSRLFKVRTGKTYISYLNTIRINHACQLLLEKQNPINEIAYECGFNHVQHFNRTFKANKGLSPRKFISLQ